MCSAKRSRRLSQRDNYGFHGFYFLFLFIYKYILDASFNFISCTQLDGEYVRSFLPLPKFDSYVHVFNLGVFLSRNSELFWGTVCRALHHWNCPCDWTWYSFTSVCYLHYLSTRSEFFTVKNVCISVNVHLYIFSQKTIQISNALTHGLKQRKRYLWYGVWDIWRRLLFIVANLFLSVSTSSTVLVSQS